MSQVTSTASRVGGNNVRQLGRAVSHFAWVEVVRPQWQPILDDLATLISDLHKSAEGRVTLPYGSTLDVQEAFRTRVLQQPTGSCRFAGRSTRLGSPDAHRSRMR